MLHFIDFEVFKKFWCCVIISPMTNEDTFIASPFCGAEELKQYYEDHKNDIFIGWNIRGYDQYIFKAILLDIDPYYVNTHIVKRKQPGYTYSSLFRNINLNFYDTMINYTGLKAVEGFMGSDIRESTVDFNIETELTDSQINEVYTYCHHDVEQTLEAFLETHSEFDSHLGLINTFDLPLSYMGKTKAQLSAIILGCSKKERHDEFDLTFVDTLKLNKYAYLFDEFEKLLDLGNDDPEKAYSSSIKADIAGIPHELGWGGIHGAKEKYFTDSGCILHVDVNSYYPALMIEYDFLSRNVRDKDRFREIRDKRLEYKKAKDPRQAPMKIVINSTYGICKDKYSAAYDPRQANNICVNGQLLLVDLIEHLEGIEGFELIQSNTDGLIIRIPDTDDAFNAVDDVCFEWETRCRMKLGFDYISKIYQKDVNNYVFVDVDGKIESKGAYVKKLTSTDNDLPIVNRAVVDYLLNRIPVEKTILECNDLMQFQKIVKISAKYDYARYGIRDIKTRMMITDTKLREKTFRVFADTEKHGTIYKSKESDHRPCAFGYVPENCFIDNSNVRDKKTPENLDKSWYISLAKQRLFEFGVIDFTPVIITKDEE